jgi:hypothetical protein
MNNAIRLNDSAGPKAPAVSRPKNPPAKAAANWKPQPCGFSREELRAILDEVMG